MPEPKSNQQFFPVGRMIVANSESDFRKLLENFSADGEKITEIVSLAISKYCEKHRFYHNLSHINALLFNAERFKKNISDHHSVRLAIWFHDLVYEPKSSSNEIESARLADEILSQIKVLPEIREKVKRMTLATREHSLAGLDADGKLFLDLDLSILGAPKSIYQRYAQAIRAEYSYVPEFLYRRMRAGVLRNFLAREFIYFSAEPREMFEARARRNMANEVKELS